MITEADADTVRRLGFIHARAEKALGIVPPPELSLEARLDAVLAGAMERPALIDARTYRLIYMLRFGGCSNQEKTEDVDEELD